MQHFELRWSVGEDHRLHGCVLFGLFRRKGGSGRVHASSKSSKIDATGIILTNRHNCRRKPIFRPLQAANGRGELLPCMRAVIAAAENGKRERREWARGERDQRKHKRMAGRCTYHGRRHLVFAETAANEQRLVQGRNCYLSNSMGATPRGVGVDCCMYELLKQRLFTRPRGEVGSSVRPAFCSVKRGAVAGANGWIRPSSPRSWDT